MAAEFNESNNVSDKTLSAADAPHLSCGVEFLTDFWEEKYLREYVKNGGSKIKFITGRPGSGKTHFLRLMTSLAAKENYKTVWFSAKDVWMHDFKEVYVEILHQSDLSGCLELLACQVIRDMGFDREEKIGRAHV